MKKVLIPLPDRDFDLTEVSIPWRLLSEKGYQIVFATEHGGIAQTDPLLITGVIFGQLGAKPQAIEFYRELESTAEFLNPIPYAQIDVNDYDLLHLPGGHASGMRQYLESSVLQEKVLQFFKQDKIVGSICHGGVILARSIDPDTGQSVVYNKRMTALIKVLEKLAYYVTFCKLGKYYRTYPEYVQDEISRNLASKQQFITGNPLKPTVIIDGNLVTARWPQDIWLYAQSLIDKLEPNTDT